MPFDPFNTSRADAAESALDAFIEAKGETRDESNMQDLITDLMHLADREEMDFAQVLRMAQMNYAAEVNPDDLETLHRANG